MEEKIEIGVKAQEDVVCASCKKTLQSTEAHSFRDKENNDVYMCENCKAIIDEEFRKESENPNYIGAIVLGILAGLISGAAWYFIEIATQRIIGLVAIGVGYVIGWAVVRGSGRKRGTGLQLISAVITLISIFGASYFSALYFINDYIADELALLGQTSADFMWVSPLDPELLKMIISPVGILIWAIGIYIAFRAPKKRAL